MVNYLTNVKIKITQVEMSNLHQTEMVHYLKCQNFSFYVNMKFNNVYFILMCNINNNYTSVLRPFVRLLPGIVVVFGLINVCIYLYKWLYTSFEYLITYSFVY